MHTHMIPSLGTLSWTKTKKKVQQELDSYFDKLIHTATSLDFPISVDIMHKYVASPTTLKKMMGMLTDELDRGARELYPDVMEARFKLQINVTVKHTDTINDYRSWRQYVTVY